MRSHILIPLVVLLVAMQSCCCWTVLGGPQPPYPITPSDGAAQRLEEKMSAPEMNPDGTFTITVTDEEATSWLVEMLSEQGTQSPISDPQVYFRNGRIEAYGTLILSGSLAVPAMAALTLTTADGKPVVTVEEVVAGPIPVPAAIVQQINETAAQMLADMEAESGGTESIIKDVQIGEGQMSITAQNPTE